MLIALPLLPVCGFVLNGSPAAVFCLGAIAFIIGVLLLVWLCAASPLPLAGPLPATERFRFTIRDLLCLTTVLFGMTMFIVSAFECEAAERASRPDPLPAVVFRHFVWELESGLVCVTIGGLIWIRSALNAAMSDQRKSG
jgi:type IV secretory pathway TrbD component